MGMRYNIIYLNILFFFVGMKRGRFGGAAEAFWGAFSPCAHAWNRARITTLKNVGLSYSEMGRKSRCQPV